VYHFLKKGTENFSKTSISHQKFFKIIGLSELSCKLLQKGEKMAKRWQSSAKISTF